MKTLVADRPLMKRQRKPGEAPLHRIPIFRDDVQVGHVGYTASAATVARFTRRPGAKLGMRDGRKAWIG